jgi:hypothetical protein
MLNSSRRRIERADIKSRGGDPHAEIAIPAAGIKDAPDTPLSSKCLEDSHSDVTIRPGFLGRGVLVVLSTHAQ